MFNPVATLLDTARALIIGGAFPPLAAYGIFSGWTALDFVLGFYSFRKLEPIVVDRI